MWSREELKNNAKLILKFNYWKALLVTFVIGLLSGGFSGLSYRYSGNSYSSNMFDQSYLFSPAFFAMISVIALIASTVGLVYYFFLAAPMQISEVKYFIAQREQPGDLNHLIYCFKNKKYFNFVKAMAWQYLFIFLWTLLFIIPGIVKSYSYRMIPYIMAENPDMDFRQAMKLSMDMTRGLKGEMFITDLSFLGWFLLGAMACGIGVIFVAPYYQATMTELYIFIREKAINTGICPRNTFLPNFGQDPSYQYQNPINQPPIY